MVATLAASACSRSLSKRDWRGKHEHRSYERRGPMSLGTLLRKLGQQHSISIDDDELAALGLSDDTELTFCSPMAMSSR
jgi:hypothetical protein